MLEAPFNPNEKRESDLRARTGWDLAHGESFLPLLEQSIDLIICPTYWTGSDGGEASKKWDVDSEKKWLETLIVSRAFENECAIVVSGSRLFHFHASIMARILLMYLSRDPVPVRQRREPGRSRRDRFRNSQPGRTHRLLGSVSSFQG